MLKNVNISLPYTTTTRLGSIDKNVETTSLSTYLYWSFSVPLAHARHGSLQM